MARNRNNNSNKGRSSIKGAQKKDKKYERVNYSIEFKRKVIKHLEDVGSIESTIKHFWKNLSSYDTDTKRRQLYQWKKYLIIKGEVQGSKKKHRPMGLTCVLPKEVELHLANWVRSLRSEGIPVSNQFITIHALILAEENGIDKFKASYRWVEGFRKTYKFSKRYKTNQSQTCPGDVELKRVAFAAEVREMMAKLGVDVVWNGDQTPVQYEMIPKTTIDTTGAKTVWMRCSGKDKERISCMLLGCSKGEKKQPMLILKQIPATMAEAQQISKLQRNGFGPRIWSEVKAASMKYQIECYGNHNAWFTGELIIKWLRHNFGSNQFLRKPILLLLDEFTGHNTPEVLEMARQLNITIMTVPAGCTSKCQPADVAWNKPFKGYMRQQWTDKLMADLRENREAFKAEQPTLDDVIGWINYAWSFLTKDTIINGFIKAGFVNNRTEVTEQVPTQPPINELISALERLNMVEVMRDEYAIEVPVVVEEEDEADYSESEPEIDYIDWDN